MLGLVLGVSFMPTKPCIAGYDYSYRPPLVNSDAVQPVFITHLSHTSPSKMNGGCVGVTIPDVDTNPGGHEWRESFTTVFRSPAPSGLSKASCIDRALQSPLLFQPLLSSSWQPITQRKESSWLNPLLNLAVHIFPWENTNKSQCSFFTVTLMVPTLRPSWLHILLGVFLIWPLQTAGLWHKYLYGSAQHILFRMPSFFFASLYHIILTLTSELCLAYGALFISLVQYYSVDTQNDTKDQFTD